MDDFLGRLQRGGRVLADGGWGSLLIERGLLVGQPPETWTLERPGALRDVAREYLDAGAEILNSNTFGASPVRLRQHHLEDRFEEINARAIELLRDIAAGAAWVSGSIGPTGRLLQPYGDLPAEEAYAAFHAQAGILGRAGADLLTIETMTDLAEALLAVRAAKNAAPGVPVVATMTFEVTRRGAFTVMGTGVATAATELAGAGADVVGANCGEGLDAMLVVAREFQAHARVPVAVRPNAGLPVRQGTRLVYSETPERFAAAAREFLDAGAAVFGGCCGTTPAHTAAIRSSLGSFFQL